MFDDDDFNSFRGITYEGHTHTHTHTHTHWQTFASSILNFFKVAYNFENNKTNNKTQTNLKGKAENTIRVFEKLNQNAPRSGKCVVALSLCESTWDVDQVVCPCNLQATLSAQQKPWNEQGMHHRNSIRPPWFLPNPKYTQSTYGTLGGFGLTPNLH